MKLVNDPGRPQMYSAEIYGLVISLWQTTKLTAKQIAHVANIPLHVVYRIRSEYPLFCLRKDD